MESFRDFFSKDDRQFNFQIGRRLASSLSGFIAGVIVTSIIWLLAVYLHNVASF
jgi:hypothetical protein